jgi:integrase
VLLTGRRFSEAIDLDWSQVDLEAGEVHLTGVTNYVDVAKSISREARTLEAAMQIDEQVFASIRARHGARPATTADRVRRGDGARGRDALR